MTTIPFNLDGTDDVDMTPRNTIITDEMVDKVEDVFAAHPYGSCPRKDAIRAALEAVAPALIAPYKEVCDKFWSAYDILNDLPDDSDKAMAGGLVDEALLLYAEIRRAQELDPK